jgi:hypothetical protein
MAGLLRLRWRRKEIGKCFLYLLSTGCGRRDRQLQDVRLFVELERKKRAAFLFATNHVADPGGNMRRVEKMQR